MKNIWLGPWAVFSCVNHAKNSDICSFEAKLTMYLGFLEIDKFISKLGFSFIHNSLLM